MSSTLAELGHFLELLGPFRLRGPGGDVAMASRKARALLSYLALQPDRRAPRDELAELLWGDRSDDQARQSLRQALRQLRLALGDQDQRLILSKGDVVVLAGEALATDAEAFRLGIIAGGVRDLDRALALWRGTLLDGLELDEPRWSEWLARERARWNELRRAALAGLADAHGAEGDVERALVPARLLVELDPLDGPAQHRLIELLAQARGRESALAQYRVHADMLRRERKIDPAPVTESLAQRIDQGDIARAAPRAHPRRAMPVSLRTTRPSGSRGRKLAILAALGVAALALGALVPKPTELPAIVAAESGPRAPFVVALEPALRDDPAARPTIATLLRMPGVSRDDRQGAFRVRAADLALAGDDQIGRAHV
jgi:DNA-binding SARP family transcriptional activator